MLSIKLFGTFEARVNGAVPGSLRSRSGAELLAILCLNHDKDLRSTWVAQMLWPETGSLDSLRQGAKAVREALGDEAHRLELRNQTICLRTDGADIDVVAFDAALIKGDPEALRLAVALYRGPLLQDWDEGWVTLERKIRKERYFEALQNLARFAQAEGDCATAARCLRALVNNKPSLESAWCGLMVALADMGERLEALDVYNRYRDYLGRVSNGKFHPPPVMIQLVDQLHALPRHPVDAEFMIRATKKAAIPTDCDDVVSGPAPPTSPYYVIRPADAIQTDAITRGNGILLITGQRQVGKSSLMARGLAQARRQGAQVILTDLHKLNAAQVGSIDAFFVALAQMIADQIDGVAAPRDAWDADRTAISNFERFLRREVLVRTESSVVWAIFNVSRLFASDYKDDVFGLFRAWHNEQCADPNGPWRRWMLTMDFQAEAHPLITDPNQSFFNVGARITLQDFTEDQLCELIHRYRLEQTVDVRRLRELVGGHPYLARASLHAIQKGRADLHSIEDDADREDGLFRVHLDRIFRSIVRESALSEAMREILNGRRPSTLETFHALRAAGVIVGHSIQEARPRCGLYEVYLKSRLF